MGNVGYGQMTPFDAGSEFNVATFIMRSIIARIETMRLVKVVAVHGGGTAAGAPTVDVQPLVNQIDGNGNGAPHGVVNGIRTMRLQAGANAVVLDPKAGDVGYVICASRDSSAVTGADTVNPASFRTFNLSDGVYVGGVMTSAPTQWVTFTDDGVEISDANGNTIVTSALGITMTFAGGNQILMRAGFVNIIAPVLQVNGVPVTVP